MIVFKIIVGAKQRRGSISAAIAILIESDAFHEHNLQSMLDHPKY